MNNKILEWLKSPYPLLYGEGRDYFQIIVTTMFIGALIVVIQPFGLASLSSESLVIFVVKVSIAAMLVSILVTQIAPKFCFNEDHWQIWKQAALVLFNFSAVALVLQLLVLEELGLATLLQYLVITILVALGPLLIRLLLTQNRLLKINLEQAQLVNQGLESKTAPISKHEEAPLEANENKEKKLLVKTDDGEPLLLSCRQFIYAKAEKNYVEIFYLVAEDITTAVLRMSFSSLIQQLSDGGLSVIHCHRSFLVNQLYISKIAGNSRGYSLELSQGDIVIPVSRAKAEQVLIKVRA